MRPLPINLILACVIALLPVPALMLMDWASGGCGDGLCGFLPGMMLFGVLAVGTIIFVRRSAGREETPPLARLLPLLLWGSVLLPLLA